MSSEIPQNVYRLTVWMVEHIGKNKDRMVDPENGVDWDWVASDVWNCYPGIFNEFVINDAIDLILEAASIEND